MNCNEIWKDVPGFEGIYQISNMGRLKSFKQYENGKILKLTNKDGWYFNIILQAKGKQTRSVKIHRLVAEAFVENANPKEFNVINHINGDKQDNRACNLEWCTAQYNVLDALKRNPDFIKPMIERNKRVLSKPVYQYTKRGEFIAEYGSIVEASKKTGVCMRDIALVAQGIEHRKSAGGYVWKRKEVI